jgi:hypothetical protein
MATVRYAVEGVPAQWNDAWLPMPTLSPAGATSVSRFTFGAPGTEPVPSPRPAGSMAQSTSREWAPPSAVAPTYFCPQLYINDIRELGPQVHYMPKRVAPLVPPVGNEIGPLGGLGPSPVAMNGRKTGGLRAMFWPRSRVSFPPLGGGT